MYRNNGDASHWQSEFMTWAPRIVGAIAILIIAWLLARAAKWAIAKAVDKVPALRKHYETEPGKTLGSLIGDIAFWLILLIGIMLALQPLNLGQVLDPVRQLTTNALSFIPNVVGAGLIFFIGLIVARIVRRLVEGALLAANADGWLRKTGISEGAGTVPAGVAGAPPSVSGGGKTSISRSVGMVVFFLIMIPVTISALDALKIEAISRPATQMLQTILNAIPNVLAALLLLGIGYVVGKLAKGAIEQLLPSMGFDNSVAALGISSERVNPSRTVGTIAMIAIILGFAVPAVERLNSPLIAAMLAQILELGGQVIFGTVIILAGVAIARLVSSLVGSAADSGWLPTILRWAMIALSVAIGLRFMGLANEIVIIAFASIIGSAAVACALAFGLGGRPTAHKLLERWTDANRMPAPPAPPTPPAPPAPPVTPPVGSAPGDLPPLV
ncbi:MAG TPA: mechanosensitive ion channel [Allosphingosinicella sp.]|jgi:hypothetical protein